VEPEALLAAFADAADAQAAALATLHGPARRERTDRPGQYALDLVADAAVLEVLAPLDVAVVSEESGRSGPAGAAITVVGDPVAGSTNSSRDLPYWAISLCALDADGALCALVANPVTGERFTAARGRGATVGEQPLRPSSTTRIADSVLAVSGWPTRHLGWKQYRALGSAALQLCDVAAGRFDALVDTLPDRHAPWDYLGGVLVCTEAGAVVTDAGGRDLVTADPDARRTLLAAGTPPLLDELRTAVAS
jgi:myo-inositol-1(or 4)-monophosphatase